MMKWYMKSIIYWTADVKSNELFRLPNATAKIASITTRITAHLKENNLNRSQLCSIENCIKFWKSSTAESRRKIVPGQGARLQDCVCRAFPSQFFPPYLGGGLLQVLILRCTPPAQVRLQGPHGFHSDQRPSTTNRRSRMWIQAFVSSPQWQKNLRKFSMDDKWQSIEFAKHDFCLWMKSSVARW